jgi:hypothetical protein
VNPINPASSGQSLQCFTTALSGALLQGPEEGLLEPPCHCPPLQGQLALHMGAKEPLDSGSKQEPWWPSFSCLIHSAET